MTFSVITVCYNAAASIRTTLDSVSCQSFSDYEHLIIDGNSSDKTLDIIKEHTNPRIVYHSEPDSGIYDAMNKGIKKARGEWIIFINAADKLLSNDILQKIEPLLDRSYLGLYAPVVTSKGETSFVPDNLDLDFVKGSMINHQGIIYNREAFDKIGLYSLRYRFSSDYEHLLKIFQKSHLEKPFKKIPFPISHFDMNGVSNVHSKKRLWEYIHIRIRTGYFYLALKTWVHLYKNRKIL